VAKYGNYDFPDELYYHKEHSWARVEDGRIRVGMNDMFRSTAGDIVFVDLPSEGDEVAQGEVCGKIQSSKWIGKLYAPVGGEVVEINEDLSDDPALINKDPYGAGWLVVIEPSDQDTDLANLMKGDSPRRGAEEKTGIE
jgi:glycine cleavage system H protein